ncbi:MAG: DUF4397 domain-containing protein [Flavipsychrobacter sp.]|nr:DUF4397 domain-containing protein [Flavipsychrobacter sp.]
MSWRNTILAGWISCLALAGCLKQEDKTGEGPKTNILLVNAALDAAEVNLLLDGEPLSPADLAFGEASVEAENGYIKARPGIQTVGWKIGGETIINDKFLIWNPNSYYTVLHFDTAVNGFGRWTIIEDDPEFSDTLAKVRFINCVAGPDSLSLWLINSDDTLQVSNRRAFLEATGIIGTAFTTKVFPGTWRYELIDKNNAVLETAELLLTRGEVYSFIGIGETGSTGTKQPRTLVVRQKK